MVTRCYANAGDIQIIATTIQILATMRDDDWYTIYDPRYNILHYIGACNAFANE